MKKAILLISLVIVLVVPNTININANTVNNDPKEISLSFSGDILIHEALYNKAKTKKGYNFDPQLIKLKPYLDNDLDICHLETPLTNRDPKTYPIFATPYQIAETLQSVGFEGCSIASNHSLDQGEKGLIYTKKILLENNLKASGTRINKKDQSFAHYKLRDINITHMSYTYSTNGISNTNKLVNSPINVNNIIKEAERFRKEGSDLVILSLHFGNEYQITPSDYQKQVINKLTKKHPFDIIVGHHAHVAQPAEIVNGTPVFYGLGNLLSGQGGKGKENRQWGVLLTLKLSKEQNKYVINQVNPIPVIVDQKTFTATPVTTIDQKHYLAKPAQAATKSTKKLYENLFNQLALRQP